MQTITFYSYKGGVGRTLALSNTAMYLSKFGINVCVLDLDLEAPGLHYKFPNYFEPSDIKKGIVDYLYEFAEKKRIPDSIENFSYQIISPESEQGSLKIIPAGNVISPDYWKKLSSINWQDFLYNPEKEGILFFLELKERIRSEINPEFLLIDSRTGVTEMGGISTSLLADKVIFFLTNNKENIEGTYQILRSVRNAERLPKQDPVKTVFVLTRIPFFKDSESKVENGIIEAVRSRLSQIAESSDKNAEIGEIVVLHSDRNLEISETLAISNSADSTSQNTILGDYLRLFSNVIPERVIIPKLDTIIKKILQSMLSDPDKAQSEFESLVKTYPHKKTYESLINFYILRNIDKKKILTIYNELWNITKNIGIKLLEKYVSLFIKEENYYVHFFEYRYNLEIIKKYLECTQYIDDDLIIKLADTYNAYRDDQNALKLYSFVLDRSEQKNKILAKMINIYQNLKEHDRLKKLCVKYKDIIESDLSLKVKYIEALDHLGDFEELSRLTFGDNGDTENYLWTNNPKLLFKICDRFGVESKSLAKLDLQLSLALANRDFEEINKIGEIYYNIGKKDTFISEIAVIDENNQIINALEKKARDLKRRDSLLQQWPKE